MNEELVPDDPAERMTYAMRIIAQRCLYGVDKNPLAAEMAKLSLWLLTLAKDKPFEFLDHSIRCGDSLVGLHSIDQLRHYSLKPDADDAVLFKGPLDSAVDEAINLRLKLEDMPANSVDDVQRQEKLLIEANEKIARLRCAADLLVAAEFWAESAKDKLERVRHASNQSVLYFEKGPTDEFERIAVKKRRGQTMFHWPLEFPEVIVKRGGFDAFVGNPPFMAGRAITGQLGDFYLDVLRSLAGGSVGQTDLCAYFFLRSFGLLRYTAAIAFVATNTISQGDTSAVALATLLNAGATVFRAVPSQQWPGEAAVFISLVHIYKGDWRGVSTLNGQSVELIDAKLQAISVEADPQPLLENAGKSFKGYDIGGLGFTFTPDEYRYFISEHPEESSVIHPYINGLDFYSSPTQQPSRYAINFVDMRLDEAAAFPACLQRVRDLVKPQRDKVNRQRNRERWWLYSENRPGMRQAIAECQYVVAKTQTSKTWAFSLLPATYLFDQKLVVIPTNDMFLFAVLQSEIHYWWAERQGSSLKGDMAYTPSDCFQTYPFPSERSTFALRLKELGHRYYECRNGLMRAQREGLTATYNRLHNPDETNADTQKLRDLHVEMDKAVAAAYGWTDLDLGHGFHETKQGVRFTISEPARREVLQRLLKLNHERYAEEVKQGLHGKKGAAKKAAPKKKAASKPAKQEASLFDGEDDE